MICLAFRMRYFFLRLSFLVVSAAESCGSEVSSVSEDPVAGSDIGGDDQGDDLGHDVVPEMACTAVAPPSVPVVSGAASSSSDVPVAAAVSAPAPVCAMMVPLTLRPRASHLPPSPAMSMTSAPSSPMPPPHEGSPIVNVSFVLPNGTKLCFYKNPRLFEAHCCERVRHGPACRKTKRPHESKKKGLACND